MDKGLHKGVLDLVDARLRYLDITRWTNITISNRFAAEAITLYLEMNQPWWAFFDADMFLDDLISGETEFCSRLLVNALLAWSTQSYAHYEPMAAALSAKFLDEASQIYDIERDLDRLTTVAATSLMSMTWTTLGKDKAGRDLQYENASMAERLGLYGGSDDLSRSPLDLHKDSVKAAASATAWGSFNFQMVMSMSYRQEPLPKGPPRFNIPVEIWVSVGRPAAPYFKSTYVSVCQFWLVAFEMNYIYYSKKAASISSAVSIFQKLLAWADTLQEGVRRDEHHNPDHVLNLHIWFHTAVIDLFRPFADEQPQPKLAAFAETHATPAAVIAASIQQLKRLIYQYRSGFESAKYSIIWQSGMLYLVNHILREFSSNEAQFYFLLCMRGYQHLARHMPFVSGIVQSLFAIAMQQGTVLTDDAQRLFYEVRSENHRSQQFLSAYPVDLKVASKDPLAATLERLAENFQELTVGISNKTCEPTTMPPGWKGTVASMSAMLTPHENDIE